MACCTDPQLQGYLEDDLNAIELALVRDHLLVCPACRQRADGYQRLNRGLDQPVLAEPPDSILRAVMHRLYPDLPRYSSIAALIAASFIFLVSWIYIYFDFSHNSMIRALQVTSDNASGWFVSTIKVISSLFAYTFASFKAIRAFLQVVAHVDVGIETIALLVLTLSLLFFYGLFHLFTRRLRKSRT